MRLMCAVQRLILVLLRSSENADAFGRCAMRSTVLKVVMKGHLCYREHITNELKPQDQFFPHFYSLTCQNSMSGI